jgi:flagellar biosynthesis anti-sigma factor FlgM
MSTISQLNGQQRLRAATAAAELRRNAAATGVGMPAAARQPDAVTLSDKARSMIAATRVVANAPDVREDRVSAIKSAIAAGTYSVDSRHLASKLVTSLGI